MCRCLFCSVCVCVCVDYGAWVFVLFTLLRPKPCAPRQPTDTMISYAFFTARSEQQWEGLRAEEAGKKRRNGEKEKEKEKERTKERGMGVKGKSWITAKQSEKDRERENGGRGSSPPCGSTPGLMVDKQNFFPESSVMAPISLTAVN